MAMSSEVSQAALEAGVPARFHYFYGRSGRRYLFTSTGGDTVGDFSDGVAIAVRAGSIVWAGAVSAFEAMPATAWTRRAALYVHLIAATDAERRALIDDLRPDERCHLKLAA